MVIYNRYYLYYLYFPLVINFDADLSNNIVERFEKSAIDLM